MKENYQVREAVQESAGVRTTLDDTASVQIMKAIIELYAKPGDAILREITSNAWDSHRLAGQTRPVEVTLPNHNSRDLIIEDFGVGLDWSQIPNAFAKIGFSTKRNNNQQRGSFGFGAKSPILLSNKFTVRAVKNGVETVVEIRKDADGIGELFLQSETPTDAPNGVKLTIPLKNHYQFEEDEILTNFFVGWEQGSIKINGKFPKRCLHDDTQFEALTIGEDPIGWVSKTSYQNANTRLFASFLGVIYPIKSPSYYDSYSSAYEKLRHYGRLVYLSMPASSVEVTPSREELQYNQVTNNALKVAMEAVVKGIEMQTQQQIEMAASKTEALRLYVAARNDRLWLADLTYHGEQIPASIQVRDPFMRLRKKDRKKSTNTFNDFADMTGNNFDIVGLSERTTILVQVDEITQVAALRRKFSVFHEGYQRLHPESKKVEVFFHTFDVTNSWLASAATEVFTVADYETFVKMGRETYKPQPQHHEVKRYMVADEMAQGSWTISVKTLTAEEIRERAGDRPIIQLPFNRDKIAYATTHRNLRNYRSIRVKGAGRLAMRTLQQDALVVYTENKTMAKYFEREFPENILASVRLRELADAEFARVAGQFENAGIAAVLKDSNHPSWRRNYGFYKFAKALEAANLLDQVANTEVRELLASLVVPVPSESNYNKDLLDWYNMNPKVNAQNQPALARAGVLMNAYLLFPNYSTDYTSTMVQHVLTYMNNVTVPAPEPVTELQPA